MSWQFKYGIMIVCCFQGHALSSFIINKWNMWFLNIFRDPFCTPRRAPTPKLRNCAPLVFSQTVSCVYCYFHRQHSDVWAKITDDHVDEAGAVTIPVHLCDCWHGKPHFSICLFFTCSNLQLDSHITLSYYSNISILQYTVANSVCY